MNKKLTTRSHRVCTTRSFSPRLCILHCRVLTNLHKFSVQSRVLPLPSTACVHSLHSIISSWSGRDLVQKTSREQVITFLRSFGEVFFFLVPCNYYCIPNDIIQPTELVGTAMVHENEEGVSFPPDSVSIRMYIFIYTQSRSASTTVWKQTTRKKTLNELSTHTHTHINERNKRITK